MPTRSQPPTFRLSDDTACDVEVQQQDAGGFGQVFMGPNRFSNGVWVALKTLRADVFDPASRAWDEFMREGLIWVGLWPHANLLDAITVTRINGRPFLVLAYAKYGSLRRLLNAALDRQERLTPAGALDLAQHIAAGLVALHTPDPTYLRPHPLVHRDLKPENVLLDARGIAKITDFGLAKVIDITDDDELRLPADLEILDTPSAQDDTWGEAAATTMVSQMMRAQRYHTERGKALGTPAYMAPEQWVDAAQAGPPADLYAFGAMLAELFTGRHALLDLDRAYSIDAWRVAHASGAPRPLATLMSLRPALLPMPTAGQPLLPTLPTLPPVAAAQLEALYQACLAKEAAARPTAAEALAVLRRVAEALGQPPYIPPDVFPHTTANEVTLWHNWASTYNTLGLHAEGLRRSDRAYALAPSDPTVLTVRGDLLAALGRRSEALAMTDAALAALPAADVRRRMMVLNNKGKYLQQEKRFEQAEAAYAQALRLEPDAILPWFNRAITCLLCGVEETQAGRAAHAQTLWSQAVVYAERAVARNPQNPTFLKLLADLRRLVG